MIRRTIILTLIIVLCLACQQVAPLLSPKKERSEFKDTDYEKRVNHFFWNTLHQGKYEKLDTVLESLHYAYLQDPNDFKIAAHLGFAYTWKVTERHRVSNLKPSITENGDLAEVYFSRAVQLNAKDPRLLGFKSGLMLSNASRHNDVRQSTEAYFLGKKAIHKWPSFNLFSIGYVMSVLPHHHKRFKEALEMQWKNLEACLCRKINRKEPNLSDLNKIPERVAGNYFKSRACVNSWIAPHNVEGFMLNLGDMLVKNGDTAQAREVYESIVLIAEYKSWPFKDMRQKRLKNIRDNVSHFRSSPEETPINRQVYIQTQFGCMGCHQKSVAEFKDQNKTVPLNRNTYFLNDKVR